MAVKSSEVQLGKISSGKAGENNNVRAVLLFSGIYIADLVVGAQVTTDSQAR